MLDRVLDKNEDFFAHLEIESVPFQTKKMKTIERRVCNILLNGYETHQPLGKKAESADISVFVSAITENVFDVVEETIKKVFAKANIEHHSFALMSFATLRDIFHNNTDFVVADISGETTDVLLARDNILLDTMSFPMGNESVIRRVRNVQKFDHSIAESAITMYLRGELHDESSRDLVKILSDVSADWQVHFVNAMRNLSGERPVPKIIYMIADKHIFNFFEQALDLTKSSYLLRNTQIVNVSNMELIDKFIAGSVSEKKDTVLNLAIIYIHNLRGGDIRKINNYVVE
jgi:hypothetical protein